MITNNLLQEETLNKLPLKHVHKSEAKELCLSVSNSARLGGCEKALALLNLALYSREPGALQLSVAALCKEVTQRMRNAQVSPNLSELRVFEELDRLEHS